MKDFTGDNSAWADFLISKAALILVSIVLFVALFHLIAEFKDLEAQQQLESLAQDFKTRVDETGTKSLQEEFPNKFSGSSQETFDSHEAPDSQGVYNYRFSDKDVFRALPFREDVKVLVSGEYVCLEAKSDERIYRAVKPFAFRVLPCSEPMIQDKLRMRFGAEGSEKSPLKADYKEVLTYLQDMGTQETILDPEEYISIKKENLYISDREGVFTFGCILVYQ